VGGKVAELRRTENIRHNRVAVLLEALADVSHAV
jgi:hypothetical protein